MSVGSLYLLDSFEKHDVLRFATIIIGPEEQRRTFNGMFENVKGNDWEIGINPSEGNQSGVHESKTQAIY